MVETAGAMMPTRATRRIGCTFTASFRSGSSSTKALLASVQIAGARRAQAGNQRSDSEAMGVDHDTLPTVRLGSTQKYRSSGFRLLHPDKQTSATTAGGSALRQEETFSRSPALTVVERKLAFEGDSRLPIATIRSMSRASADAATGDGGISRHGVSLLSGGSGRLSPASIRRLSQTVVHPIHP